MTHIDNPEELHLSRRRNNRATEPTLFYPQHQHKQHSRRNKQPDLQVVTEEYVHQPRVRKVELIPKSLNQETYIELLNDHSKLIIFATGPAGTGKTMMAVLAAIKAYQNGECKKIVITRPAVGVDDEEHGFLPGDLNQKMAPWTRPIMDVFAEYYRQSEIAKMLDEQTIEIAPLAFQRGRTFKNSWIIFDESQNSSINQMKMMLTRLGENSRLVVTGDLQQKDKQFYADNGLQDFMERLAQSNSKRISLVSFARRDVQRHPVVSEVLSLYGEE
jgi:phosphate starvation-inducible PhoH-like protein